ncbi:MAG TPA: ABC transporter permease [Dehalococcoidia bacterium]|nr:ABC transporter permease [Dehalococcoidia bacterium]
MLRYTIFRVAWMVPSLLALSLITFVFMHLTPGSPLQPDAANNPLTPAEQNVLKKQFGLDKPVWQQYTTFLGNALRLNFGKSYVFKTRSVTSILKKQTKVSVELGLVALAIAVVGGLGLGIMAAMNQNGPADYVCTFLAMLGIALPNFVLGVFLILLFVLVLHWIPRTGGWTSPTDVVLPAIALGMTPLATIARYTRSSMVDVIRSDYVRTARAKGLAEPRVMLVHVVKNGLIPPLTIMAPIFAAVLTGSPAIESIFRIPGIGQYFVQSFTSRDYPMIMAIILLLGVFIIVLNLVVDLLYGVVDPRIRYS